MFLEFSVDLIFAIRFVNFIPPIHFLIHFLQTAPMYYLHAEKKRLDRSCSKSISFAYLCQPTIDILLINEIVYCKSGLSCHTRALICTNPLPITITAIGETFISNEKRERKTY